jgi:hypothetical protein
MNNPSIHAKFFTELNRRGNGRRRPRRQQPVPSDYQALMQVWREHQMTVRVAYR